MMTNYDNFSDMKKSVKNLCDKYGIKDWTQNSDGSIDVYGNVSLTDRYMKKLPLKFNEVHGYFDCSQNELTTLLGIPKVIGGSFYCYNNNLTTLIGGPIIANEGYY